MIIVVTAVSQDPTSWIPVVHCQGIRLLRFIVFRLKMHLCEVLYLMTINQAHLNSTGFIEQVSVVRPIQLKTCAVIKKVISEVLWFHKQVAVSGRFQRSGPQCACSPLFVLLGMLALSREFFHFIFMTGNAHHKSLVRAYISAGNWLVGWKTTLSRSHTDLQRHKRTCVFKAKAEIHTLTHTPRRQAPEGL